jgi:hypothetical protein
MAATTYDRIGSDYESVVGRHGFAFGDRKPQGQIAAQFALKRGFINIGRNNGCGGDADLREKVEAAWRRRCQDQFIFHGR